MIITFIGHSYYSEEIEDLQEHFSSLAINEKVDFYVGGYGKFDNFALDCAIKYREKQPKSKIFFITPYIYNGYYKINALKEKVDEVIYPGLENVPPKFAILKRNEWMIDKADVVIAFVKYSWGGARTAYEYALRKKKKIINVAK